MRTTLNLQDDAFQAASHYAAARAMKLGDAVPLQVVFVPAPAPVPAMVVK